MSDTEQSLITDEHRATIGVKGDPVRVVLNEEDVHRMRDQMEDPDPRFADGSTQAPPYAIAALWGRPNRGLMPQVLPRGLLTQLEWRFFKPLEIGAELDAVSSVVDIRERLGGRHGHSVLVTLQTEYVDMEGEPVAATLQTFTQFDPEAASS